MADKEVTEVPAASSAGTVAVGIFSSKVLGFVREMATAFFFGVSAYADVFRIALRAPNLLQNLLGEGTISAAFIPIYSRMLEEGREQDAGRFAGAIFGLVLSVASTLVLLGIAFAPVITGFFVPGWIDDAARVSFGEIEVNRFDLTVRAVRIVFPMTGILVLSAWALGVLNSHRRFFLPYFAPVFWNVAIIAAMFIADAVVGGPFSAQLSGTVAPDQLTRILFAAFFGALIGGILQFGVQLPLVFRLLRHFKFSVSLQAPGVKQAVKAVGPVIAGRGVVQFSGYIDMVFASLLMAGAISAVGYAQTLYLLPISLFGMSIAASELPELSRISEARFDTFMLRLDRSLRQILFVTVPTVVAYVGLGYLIAAILYRRGNFGVSENWLVYFVLAGYSIGLLPATATRLMQNAFYALTDTRTPARTAIVRVVVSAVVALPLMFFFDRYAVAETLGLRSGGEKLLYFGAVGLALGSTIGAWVEILMLRHALVRRVDTFRFPWHATGRIVGLSVASLLPAYGIWWQLRGLNITLTALVVLVVFGLAYLGLSLLTRTPELEAWTGRFRRRGGK
jgi:putative peptidoglycan lipid II flippase